MGYRLIAMPFLSLASASLVYGSCDAGAHVHRTDERFYELMLACARHMHLAEHVVCGQVTLCSAGDVEGRIGEGA